MSIGIHYYPHSQVGKEMGKPVSRSIGKLSAIAAEKRTKPGRHSDGGGLYLNVSTTGSKSWLFMWVKDGKRREMGLGPFPAISLKSARDKASKCRNQVAEGLDPIVERDRQVGKTFGDCADEYISAMERNWRNAKHRQQWRMTLDVYCSGIRRRPVAEVDTGDVLAVLTPLWSDKNETASRLRGRIENVLDFARSKGWRTGENPARWRGHLKNILPARTKLSRGHHAAMPYQDVPVFVARLRERDAIAARALEFLVLTIARSGEVLGATWNEIDLTNALWTVPAHRMKAAEEHVVPLSKDALSLLERLSEVKVSEFVFPGQKTDRPLSPMSLAMVLRRMQIKDATPHGFRSAARDWIGDQTSFPREIAEAALAHKVGNAVEQAYRRGKAIEKRRALMEAWAQYCSNMAGGEVVPIAGARQAQSKS
jgi:integrase